ncbi:MAG: ABC transporter ATP-binding protein [Polyangia bacterium]|jgi:ABC-2 type transport system ATP-binding protein|nr:ABC transporter ATP-binding protein [Polyangia bacterium]
MADTVQREAVDSGKEDRAEAPEVIRCRGLEKRFGEHLALAGLDLTVRQGQFYGLLGPNGAGKSTTVSLLTGTRVPTGGEIRLFGRKLDPDDPATKGQMGVVTEEPPLFDRLRGREMLVFVARMQGLSRKEAAQRSEDLISLLGLEEAGGKLVADYSRGMRKKLAIGCALIHGPRLLFLDEPFEGVDALSAETIRGVLCHLTSRGTTVLLTTHILTLAERLCDAYGILSRGRLAWEGSPSTLVEEGVDLTSRFVEVVGAEREASGLPAWLDGDR